MSSAELLSALRTNGSLDMKLRAFKKERDTYYHMPTSSRYYRLVEALKKECHGNLFEHLLNLGQDGYQGLCAILDNAESNAEICQLFNVNNPNQLNSLLPEIKNYLVNATPDEINTRLEIVAQLANKIKEVSSKVNANQYAITKMLFESKIIDTADFFTLRQDANNSLLLEAIKSNRLDVAVVLVQHFPAMIAVENEQHKNALSVFLNHLNYSLEQKKQFLSSLVESNIKLDQVVDSQGNTILHEVAKMGNVDLFTHVLSLLPTNADLNPRNNLSETPFYVSASHNQNEVAQFLMMNDRVNIDTPTLDNHSPLGIAIENKNASLKTMILRRKNEINEQVLALLRRNPESAASLPVQLNTFYSHNNTRIYRNLEQAGAELQPFISAEMITNLTERDDLVDGATFLLKELNGEVYKYQCVELVANDVQRIVAFISDETNSIKIVCSAPNDFDEVLAQTPQMLEQRKKVMPEAVRALNELLKNKNTQCSIETYGKGLAGRDANYFNLCLMESMTKNVSTRNPDLFKEKEKVEQIKGNIIERKLDPKIRQENADIQFKQKMERVVEVSTRDLQQKQQMLREVSAQDIPLEYRQNLDRILQIGIHVINPAFEMDHLDARALEATYDCLNQNTGLFLEYNSQIAEGGYFHLLGEESPFVGYESKTLSKKCLVYRFNDNNYEQTLTSLKNLEKRIMDAENIIKQNRIKRYNAKPQEAEVIDREISDLSQHLRPLRRQYEEKLHELIRIVKSTDNAIVFADFQPTNMSMNVLANDEKHRPQFAYVLSLLGYGEATGPKALDATTTYKLNRVDSTRTVSNLLTDLGTFADAYKFAVSQVKGLPTVVTLFGKAAMPLNALGAGVNVLAKMDNMTGNYIWPKTVIANRDSKNPKEIIEAVNSFSSRTYMSEQVAQRHFYENKRQTVLFSWDSEKSVNNSIKILLQKRLTEVKEKTGDKYFAINLICKEFEEASKETHKVIDISDLIIQIYSHLNLDERAQFKKGIATLSEAGWKQATRGMLASTDSQFKKMYDQISEIRRTNNLTTPPLDAVHNQLDKIDKEPIPRNLRLSQ